MQPNQKEALLGGAKSSGTAMPSEATAAKQPERK